MVSFKSHDRPPESDTSLPVRRNAVVTQLVLITSGVYLLQMLTSGPAGSPVTDWLALDHRAVFQQGQFWRLVTYAFCHSEANLTHLLCNMVALYFLGRIVAQTIGGREFLAVYLMSAAFAGIVQACSIAVFSPGPTLVLGASGAVSAVFMIFTLYYPRMRLMLLGIFPVQARWLLAAVMVFDVLGFLGLFPSMFLPESGSRIGHAAHLGGLTFGILYFRWNLNFTAWWDRFAGRTGISDRPRRHLKIYRPSDQPQVDMSRQVDRILDKISREGEDSLTKTERRMLQQASRHLSKSR